MTMVYYSVLASLRAGESVDEIVRQLKLQALDNPEVMVDALARELVRLVEKCEEKVLRGPNGPSGPSGR